MPPSESSERVQNTNVQNTNVQNTNQIKIPTDHLKIPTSTTGTNNAFSKYQRRMFIITTVKFTISKYQHTLSKYQWTLSSCSKNQYLKYIIPKYQQLPMEQGCRYRQRGPGELIKLGASGQIIPGL